MLLLIIELHIVVCINQPFIQSRSFPATEMASKIIHDTSQVLVVVAESILLFRTIPCFNRISEVNHQVPQTWIFSLRLYLALFWLNLEVDPDLFLQYHPIETLNHRHRQGILG